MNFYFFGFNYFRQFFGFFYLFYEKKKKNDVSIYMVILVAFGLGTILDWLLKNCILILD